MPLLFLMRTCGLAEDTLRSLSSPKAIPCILSVMRTVLADWGPLLISCNCSSLSPLFTCCFDAGLRRGSTRQPSRLSGQTLPSSNCNIICDTIALTTVWVFQRRGGGGSPNLPLCTLIHSMQASRNSMQPIGLSKNTFAKQQIWFVIDLLVVLFCLL